MITSEEIIERIIQRYIEIYRDDLDNDHVFI